MSWSQDEVQNAIAQVSLKASRNAGFRKLALSNPSAAVREVVGKDIPTGFKLKLIEGDPQADMTVVLPALKVSEVSDADLEKVAGGVCAQACGAQAER